MTNEEHREIHKLLHQQFDDRLADYLTQNRKASVQDPIYKLMRWSHEQTIEPSEEARHENVAD